MSAIQEIKHVKEQLSTGDYSNRSFDELMDQYDTLKAILSFEQTQPMFIGEPPGKKAKEIALDAAIKIYNGPTGSSFDKPENILELAKSIHEWLISHSSKPKDIES